MFVGREDELKSLDRLYAQNRFQMVVVYGRRRIGKTTLIAEFARNKRTIAFTAQAQSPKENLGGFSRALYRGFGMPEGTGSFGTWQDAFSFLARQGRALGEPVVVLFDEFPYAAEGEPSLPSALQIAIDRELLNTSVFLVLCGSNEGFMESEVLGSKSPLYGRRTAQIHLQPFDYLDASRMLPGLDARTLMRFYATFGGTPYYLSQIDATSSWEENVAALMFSSSGLLYEEPQMLLRQELREPALYNSVLGGIAQGATKPKAIAESAGLDQSSVGSYLQTLANLGLIERRIPFGDNPLRSRKGLWRLRDPFFAFWYRFVRPAVTVIELGAGEMAVREVAQGGGLPTYEGQRFEDVCMQWVARANREGDLPLFATSFGQWWGTDPEARQTCDIDLIAANRERGSILLGECKWRNSFDESEAIATLEHRGRLVPGDWQEHAFALFTKHPVSQGTVQKAASDGGIMLIDADRMLEA